MRLAPRLIVFLALLMLLFSVGPRADAAPPVSPQADAWSYAHVPGTLLVGFRPDVAAGFVPGLTASFDQYLTSLGVQVASPSIGDGNTYRLQFAPNDDLKARHDALMQNPAVAFAEPDYIMTLQSAGVVRLLDDPGTQQSPQSTAPLGPKVPNDANYPQQWGPAKIGADLDWSTITTGGPVLIAMLDTGISSTHPDLKGRVKPGFDFVNNDPDASDDNGHGTFTAGVAAATGNNSIGVAGISWGALLLPVKILDQDGRGPVSAFAQGIRYAVDQGAQVINVSAGVPVPSQTMEAAVSYAVGKGAIVVAASGNQADGVQNYPAAYPNVIAVSASTQDDHIADFSSYGSYVWVAAPGKNIVSTYFHDGDTYAELSGTSASTPFVSGAIALMLSQNGNLTASAVRQILKATAVDIGPDGFDTHSGYGRIDAFHATILATDPSSATLKAATVAPANGQNTDAFQLTASGFTPGEPVTVWLVGNDNFYRYFGTNRFPQLYANASGTIQIGLSTNEPLPTGPIQVLAYGETSKKLGVTSFVTKPAVNTQAFARVAPVPTTDTQVYFDATGHTLSDVFLQYWQQNGGLALFGYPISEPFTEVSPADGKPYTVQYFERNRFELHPEFAGTPYEVELGLLGSEATQGRSFDPAPPPLISTDTRVYFPETKHSLTGDFLQYWQQNGGLAIFGYPISEPFQEVSPTDGKIYLVQYFQRNRFELHPENAGTPYNVLLGLLGSDAAKAKGYITR
ncbi:MAG: S8 family peptidase [Thermomicrobiales bacterium]